LIPASRLGSLTPLNLEEKRSAGRTRPCPPVSAECCRRFSPSRARRARREFGRRALWLRRSWSGEPVGDLEAAAFPLHDVVGADHALVHEAAEALEIFRAGAPCGWTFAPALNLPHAQRKEPGGSGTRQLPLHASGDFTLPLGGQNYGAKTEGFMDSEERRRLPE
jgi:hypothetical protein